MMTIIIKKEYDPSLLDLHWFHLPPFCHATCAFYLFPQFLYYMTYITTYICTYCPMICTYTYISNMLYNF